MLTRIILWGKVVLILICIIVSFFLFHQSFHYMQLLNVLQDNFYNPLLQKVSLSETEDTCEFYTLSKWRGTSNGCDCSNSNTVVFGDNCQEGVCIGKCSIRQITKLCKNIPKNKEKDIKIWDTMGLCKDKKQPNYYDLLMETLVPGRTKCDEGFNNCGIIDSYNNIYCLPKDQECPVNYIKIDTNENAPNEQFKIETIPLGTDKYLHYSNKNYGGKLFGLFRIEQEKICINPDEVYNPNTNIKPYILDNVQKYGCNAVGNFVYDDRFTAIDTINKATMLYENKILQLINQLPNYPLIDEENQKVTLYSSPFIGFDKFCLKKQKFKRSYVSDGKNFVNKGSKISIALLALLFCTIIFEIGIGIINFTVEISLLSYYILWGFNGILLLVDLILACAIIHPINKIGSIKECGDAYTNVVIKSMKDDISKDRGYLIVIILFIVLAFAALIFLAVYNSFFPGKLEFMNKENKKDQPNFQEMPPEDDEQQKLKSN